MTLNLLIDGYYDESTGLYTLDEDSPTYEGLPDDQKKYVSLPGLTCCVAFCCILLRLAVADLLDHRHRYYVASDNVKHRAFVGMTPGDIIGLFEGHPLEFEGRRATGTVRASLSSQPDALW